MELFEDIFDDLDYGIGDTDPSATEMAAMEGILGIEGIYDFSATESAKTEKGAKVARTVPALIHALVIHAYNTGVFTHANIACAALSGATVDKLGVCVSRFIVSTKLLPLSIGEAVLASLICLAITSPAIIDSTIHRLEKKLNKTNIKGDVKIDKAKADGNDKKVEKIQTKKSNKISKLEDRIKILTYLRDNFRGFSHEKDLISQLNKPNVCASAVNLLNSWLRDVGEIEIKRLDRKISKAKEKGNDKKVAKLKAKKMEQKSLVLESIISMCDEDFDPAMESVVEYYFEDGTETYDDFNPLEDLF